MNIVIHPGETVKELIETYGISQKDVALKCNYSEKHISEVINGRKGITNKLAIRLGKFFKIEPSFFVLLQLNYEIETNKHNHSD